MISSIPPEESDKVVPSSARKTTLTDMPLSVSFFFFFFFVFECAIRLKIKEQEGRVPFFFGEVAVNFGVRFREEKVFLKKLEIKIVI